MININRISDDSIKEIIKYVGNEDFTTFAVNNSKFYLYQVNDFVDIMKKYIGKARKCNECRKEHFNFQYIKCRKSFKKANICEKCLKKFYYFDPIEEKYYGSKRLKKMIKNRNVDKELMKRLVEPKEKKSNLFKEVQIPECIDGAIVWRTERIIP